MGVIEANDSETRVDKWLWTARFFKTRSLATEAVAGGKVKVNGERTKPAKTIRAGDELRIHIGPYEHVIRVRGVSGRRGPAAEAALLYEESDESKAARKKLAARLAAENIYARAEKGRPSKKVRRELIRLKQGDS